MNRNRLVILLTLAAILLLSGCGGAVERAADDSARATASPSSNAPSTAPAAADSAAQAAPVNGTTAAAPSPSTTGGATQPNATLKGGERGGIKVQRADTPKPQIGSGGNDFFLFTQARGALDTDAELKAANITVEVKEGVVTLSGALANAAQKSKAEQLVRAVGGVKEVKNRLRVSGGA
jgi:hypothetical protein